MKNGKKPVVESGIDRRSTNHCSGRYPSGNAAEFNPLCRKQKMKRILLTLLLSAYGIANAAEIDLSKFYQPSDAIYGSCQAMFEGKPVDDNIYHPLGFSDDNYFAVLVDISNAGFAGSVFRIIDLESGETVLREEADGLKVSDAVTKYKINFSKGLSLLRFPLKYGEDIYTAEVKSTIVKSTGTEGAKRLNVAHLISQKVGRKEIYKKETYEGGVNLKTIEGYYMHPSGNKIIVVASGRSQGYEGHTSCILQFFVVPLK